MQTVNRFIIFSYSDPAVLSEFQAERYCFTLSKEM